MGSGDLGIAETIEQALVDPEPTWVTLPPVEFEPPASLRRALDHFDAGPTAAGTAATAWLQQSAIPDYRLSRTRLYIADGAIAGYYSLASSTVETSQRDRRRRLALDTRIGTLPATLVTWLAKDHRAKFDGTVLVTHAAAIARRVALEQASVALALDAYDDETARLWIARHGFRRSSGGSRRLWVPLAAEN